ncbi:FAD-binding oxidoreductase [Vagococcus coleopterorum]|uniref:FAD-binding oxidoreductase n=1 Tax=Vagococcus coleopterorum TaxID=2714946 RepID=A0A6G8AN72_9ENTE|nr:FAD-dependent oxidoreductase [Vagococcus coleopterorum]QIL46375.1 FAD-binding oxidoreductase [Vagococcus coleopterorum]
MNIAIIGGGIVGSTTAFYLSQDDSVTVTLYDEPTGQASSAAAGIISPWLSQRRNKNWYHLAKTGAAFYPTLIKDLGLPFASEVYKQTGTLLYKNTPELLDKLTHIATERKVEAPEIGELAVLSPAEIHRLIPLLNNEQSGLLVSGGARVDGAALVRTLKEAIGNKHGNYYQTEVTSLKKQNDLWQITTTDGCVQFDKVILTVGAWLPELLTPLGYTVDVRGQKGQLVELDIATETDQWPVVMPHGEADIIPFDNGKILIGATHENDLGYDLTSDPTKINELVQSVMTIAPTISSFKQTSTRIGTRAYTSDFLPFFGPVPNDNSILVASGLGSSGLTTGPIIGKSLADLCLERETTINIQHYACDNYIKMKDVF